MRLQSFLTLFTRATSGIPAGMYYEIGDCSSFCSSLCRLNGWEVNVLQTTLVSLSFKCFLFFCVSEMGQPLYLGNGQGHQSQSPMGLVKQEHKDNQVNDHANPQIQPQGYPYASTPDVKEEISDSRYHGNGLVQAQLFPPMPNTQGSVKQEQTIDNQINFYGCQRQDYSYAYPYVMQNNSSNQASVYGYNQLSGSFPVENLPVNAQGIQAHHPGYPASVSLQPQPGLAVTQGHHGYNQDLSWTAAVAGQQQQGQDFRKKKHERSRITYTTKQINHLEHCYKVSETKQPSKKEREKIAEVLGGKCTERNVRTWFKNRRSKERQEQKQSQGERSGQRPEVSDASSDESQGLPGNDTDNAVMTAPQEQPIDQEKPAQEQTINQDKPTHEQTVDQDKPPKEEPINQVKPTKGQPVDQDKPKQENAKGNTSKKRTRTKFTAEQLIVLKQYYSTVAQKPSSAEKQQLAKQLNLTEDCVNVWFQNERAKEKNKQANEKGAHSASIHQRVPAMPQRNHAESRPYPVHMVQNTQMSRNQPLPPAFVPNNQYPLPNQQAFPQGPSMRPYHQMSTAAANSAAVNSDVNNNQHQLPQNLPQVHNLPRQGNFSQHSNPNQPIASDSPHHGNPSQLGNFPQQDNPPLLVNPPQHGNFLQHGYPPQHGNFFQHGYPPPHGNVFQHGYPAQPGNFQQVRFPQSVTPQVQGSQLNQTNTEGSETVNPSDPTETPSYDDLVAAGLDDTDAERLGVPPTKRDISDDEQNQPNAKRIRLQHSSKDSPSDNYLISSPRSSAPEITIKTESQGSEQNGQPESQGGALLTQHVPINVLNVLGTPDGINHPTAETTSLTPSLKELNVKTLKLD